MPYELREALPTPEEYVALRSAADMGPRTLEAARRGLPNSVFGVTVVHRPDADDDRPDGCAGRRDGDDGRGDDTPGEVVGMGRLVGDDGTVYQVVDVAVHPDHQGRGLGSRVVAALMAYLDDRAPESAYVNLLADVEGFYERFGFEPTAPASNGMFTRVE